MRRMLLVLWCPRLQGTAALQVNNGHEIFDQDLQGSPEIRRPSPSLPKPHAQISTPNASVEINS
jgi:hypothetical protein